MQKIPNIVNSSIFKIFSPLNNLSKMMMWNNKSFLKSCNFDYKKSFDFTICGKCVVKVFNLNLKMFESNSILEKKFTKCFA
jgi:hypothetical protein